MGSEIIETIGLTVNNFVTNLLLMMFFKNVYSERYNNKIIYFIALIVWTVCAMGIAMLEIPIINLLFTYGSINLVCMLLYNCNAKKCWLYNIAVLLVSTLFEVFSVIIWMIVKGERLESLLSNSQYVAISCLLNMLLFYFVYRVCLAIITRTEIASVKIKEMIFLSFVLIIEAFVLLSYIEKASNQTDGIRLIIMMAGFMVFNVYMVHAIHEVAEAYRNQYKISLLQNQNEIQLAHYVEVDKKYQESKKVIHDIKKHLAILSDLKSDENSKAETYRKMIEDDVDSLVTGFQCTNQILSIVMSQKIAVAESENIRVETDVEDVTFEFMNDLDITALFANLWDNAIEASRKIDEQYRKIRFNIEKLNGFIMINVINNFNGELNKTEAGISSTKKNHEGVGLTIIKSTVEKYKGLVNLNNQKDKFIVEITIPVPDCTE